MCSSVIINYYLFKSKQFYFSALRRGNYVKTSKQIYKYRKMISKLALVQFKKMIK